MTGEIARCDISKIEILSKENFANEFNFIVFSFVNILLGLLRVKISHYTSIKNIIKKCQEMRIK